MHIRELQTNDIRELYELGKKEWKSDTWLTLSYVEGAWNQPGLSFGAFNDRKFIGGIILVYEDIVPNWLRYLIVDEAARKKGVASLLLKEVIDALPSGSSLFVDTGTLDIPALKFYEKNGFTIQGVIKEMYGKEDGVILRKIV